MLARATKTLRVTRRRHKLVPLLAASLCLAACGAEAEFSENSVGETRDSAGIALRQLRGDDEAPIAVVSAPDFLTGMNGETGDDALFFHLVEGARRLDDNRIVVANRGTNEIIVIDSLGRRVGTIGRPGGGPGEFQRLVSILPARGNAVAALDGQLRRISLFAPNGNSLRDFIIQSPDDVSGAGLAGAVGFVERGELVLWMQARLSDREIERANQPNTVVQVPRVLFTVDSAGRTVTVIGEFPSPGSYLGATVSPSGEPVLANWGPAPFGHWSGFGVYNDRIYVFSSTERGFSVFSPDGRLLSIYRGEWPTREVMPEARRLHIEEWVDRFPAWLTPEERRALFERVDYPETFPAYRDAVVGSDGIVWIEPYALWDGERRHYIGYDSTGLAIGRLSLDSKDRIMEIGHGTALLLHIAEYGVETIRLARFRF